MTIILIVVLLLGGGGGLSSLLGGSSEGGNIISTLLGGLLGGSSDNSSSNSGGSLMGDLLENVVGGNINSDTLGDIVGGLSGLLGNLNSGSTSSGWELSGNTGKLNTSVDSAAREKRTEIKGNGKDEVTIMVYMCGTDLESKYGMGTSDLQEIKVCKNRFHESGRN